MMHRLRWSQGAVAVQECLPHDFRGNLAHLLFIRKNVLEVWPLIDVLHRIKSRCPLDTWTSALSVKYGSGQTPKDVDEGIVHVLYAFKWRGVWLGNTFLEILPLQRKNSQKRTTNGKKNRKNARQQGAARR